MLDGSACLDLSISTLLDEWDAMQVDDDRSSSTLVWGKNGPMHAINLIGCLDIAQNGSLDLQIYTTTWGQSQRSSNWTMRRRKDSRRCGLSPISLTCPQLLLLLLLLLQAPENDGKGGRRRRHREETERDRLHRAHRPHFFSFNLYDG